MYQTGVSLDTPGTEECRRLAACLSVRGMQPQAVVPRALSVHLQRQQHEQQQQQPVNPFAVTVRCVDSEGCVAIRLHCCHLHLSRLCLAIDALQV